MNKRTKENAFSLMELLIVMAIILIVAAIAIPQLASSKKAANEASAVATMRVLNSASLAYSSTWSTGFPVALANLGPSNPATAAAAGLIDSTVASGTKSGYVFTYVSSAPVNGKIASYSVTAAPTIPGVTGVRYFFSDWSCVIRQNTGAAATAASTPL